MEATATASKTIADMVVHSANQFGEKPAVRFKKDGSWHDVSYSELEGIVDEIGLGLIEIGIEPGERVCILANTRPEWTTPTWRSPPRAAWWCRSTRPTHLRSANG